ncbi:hypothetical protein BGW38_002037 [Lunasporangiospora selenospora]|uniref:Uncharacterized protein n=1 Tax=Lunasporangiospora selenospora TaxID=979761 RepID=A0A9P6KDQ5_9FUNG|nr:hypothetical protein BGW38_002037 [Lunasporangiospora selenospora]
MADLGLFMDDGEGLLEQEQDADNELPYLAVSADADGSYEELDTMDVIAQMGAAEPEIGAQQNTDFNVIDVDVEQILTATTLTSVEKIVRLSMSEVDSHRVLLAIELPSLLSSVTIQDAITDVIPAIENLCEDPCASVQVAIASRLRSIIFYFTGIKDPFEASPPSTEDGNIVEETRGNSSRLAQEALIPSIILLLMAPYPDVTNTTRRVLVSVAECAPENILDNLVLDGVIGTLLRLYVLKESSEAPLQGSIDLTEVIKKLQRKEWTAWYSIDIEATLRVAELLVALAPILNSAKQVSFVVPTLQSLIRSPGNVHLKEAVMVLETYIRIAEKEIVVQHFMPMFDELVMNKSSDVKSACCVALPPLLSALPSDARTERAVVFYNTLSEDVNTSVQNSLADVIGEVIATFEPEKVPDSLLEQFLNMGQQPMAYTQRAYACAFNFPAVVLTAGRSKWEVMKPVYERLAETLHVKTRRSIASSLHEIARILGPELAARDLVEVFRESIVAEDDVKEGAFGHIVEFLSCLPQDSRSSLFQEIYLVWGELERSSNWRLRDALAGQLPALCEIADGSDLVAYLLPLSVRACNDGVSAIRESGVMSYPALWEASDRAGPLEDVPQMLGSFDDPTEGQNSNHHGSNSKEGITIREHVIRQTAEFASSSGFKLRVVTVQIIQSLLDHGLLPLEFEKHFLPLIANQLVKDKVINVRIAVARVVNWIIDSKCYGTTPIPKTLQDIRSTLQLDPDRDVRVCAGGPYDLPKEDKKKEDESSDGNKLGFLDAAKNSGISNKPRNRNSLGIGMKIMVGNKLTVGGKEIRKPKTSWDYVHGEQDEDEENAPSPLGSFSATLRNNALQNNLFDQDQPLEEESKLSSFDAPRNNMLLQEEDEEWDNNEGKESTPNGQDSTPTEHGVNSVAKGKATTESFESIDSLDSHGKTALAGQELLENNTTRPSSAPLKDLLTTGSRTDKSAAEFSLSHLKQSDATDLGPVRNESTSETDSVMNGLPPLQNGAVSVSAAESPGLRKKRLPGAKGFRPALTLSMKPIIPDNLVTSTASSSAASSLASSSLPMGHHSVLDTGSSASYAAVVASGASSPHPGRMPSFPPPLSPMVQPSSPFKPV